MLPATIASELHDRISDIRERELRDCRWLNSCSYHFYRISMEPRTLSPKLSGQRTGGFVLAEHLIAGGMMVVFAMSALVALVQANRLAAASRLQAIALAVAQQRIDEILTTP